MKKLLLALFVLCVVFLGIKKVNAITYEEAMNQSKPTAMLIYATWADDLEDMKQNFITMEEQYGQSYNFVLLDIASVDTKAFNKRNHIYPNLPYVLLFKERGKISRYLQKNCVLDTSCFSEKLNFFNN